MLQQEAGGDCDAGGEKQNITDSPMSFDHCAGGRHSGYCLGKLSWSQKVWKVTWYTARVSCRHGVAPPLLVGEAPANRTPSRSKRRDKVPSDHLLNSGRIFGFFCVRSSFVLKC